MGNMVFNGFPALNITSEQREAVSTLTVQLVVAHCVSFLTFRIELLIESVRALSCTALNVL